LIIAALKSLILVAFSFSLAVNLVGSTLEISEAVVPYGLSSFANSGSTLLKSSRIDSFGCLVAFAVGATSTGVVSNGLENANVEDLEESVPEVERGIFF